VATPKVKVALVEKEYDIRRDETRLSISYDGLNMTSSLDAFLVRHSAAGARYAERAMKERMVRAMESEWSAPLREALGI
jgi:hypothetical protein